MRSIELIKPLLKENLLKIAVGLCCLVTVDILQLIIPRIIKRVVDDLTIYDADPFTLVVYAGYLLGVGVMIGCFRYFWRRCLMGTARRIEEALRNRLFDHVQRLSSKYFDNTTTGDLMAHATNDIQQVRMACGMGMVALNDAVVLGTAAIGFMIYINFTLTLYVLIPMPFIVFGAKFFSKQMHRRYQEVQGAFAGLTESVRERFSGIRVVKAYNYEPVSYEKVSAISQDYVSKNVELTKITGSFFPMMLLFTNLSMFVVLFLGGRKTIAAEITPGDFVAFISYLGLLTWPMMALGWVTNLIQRGRASLDRLERIIHTVPEVSDRPDALSLAAFRSGIVFNKVVFTYDQNKPPALDGIDLKIPCSRITGIIGPPGSGKTTVLMLLSRLYDVSGGSLSVDGIDIRKFKLRDLRSMISYTPQEPYLFSGTIRDNITFGNPLVTEEKMILAAQQADVLKTIESFPKGFDTIVGERGIILSGGQKQRVALARGLLKNAPIMVFDDPISQVDTRTGNRIIQTLKELSGKKTMIIVSHRISAVSHADNIIVFDNGAIVDSGSHNELLTRNSYYQRTFQLQELEHAI